MFVSVALSFHQIVEAIARLLSEKFEESDLSSGGLFELAQSFHVRLAIWFSSFKK